MKTLMIVIAIGLLAGFGCRSVPSQECKMNDALILSVKAEDWDKAIELLGRGADIYSLWRNTRLEDPFVSTITNWVSKDSIAAAMWAELLPGKTAKYRFSATCPATTKGWREEMKARALRIVGEAWVKLNTELAIKWAQQLLDEDARINAIYGVIEGWAEKDPLSAAKWIQEDPKGLPKGTYLDQAYRLVVFHWARHHPQEAALWAEQLPLGEGRDSALSCAAYNWSGEDPEAACKFVEKLGAGHARDNIMADMVYTWAKKDPKAAANWIRQSSLPVTTKTELLKRNWFNPDN